MKNKEVGLISMLGIKDNLQIKDQPVWYALTLILWRIILIGWIQWWLS
jgi:hypothetical protein